MLDGLPISGLSKVRAESVAIRSDHRVLEVEARAPRKRGTRVDGVLAHKVAVGVLSRADGGAGQDPGSHTEKRPGVDQPRNGSWCARVEGRAEDRCIWRHEVKSADAVHLNPSLVRISVAQ